MPFQSTALTLPTGQEQPARLWTPVDGTPHSELGTPLTLHSSALDLEQWTLFAESMSRDRRVYALWDSNAYLLLQSMWAVGEPSILLTQGPDAGEVGLQVAQVARGAVAALGLVDYHLSGGTNRLLSDLTCPTAVIRGRQSNISDHSQAVEARNIIGPKCRLIELENCADQAAQSCPDEFETAIRWFLEGEVEAD